MSSLRPASRWLLEEKYGGAPGKMFERDVKRLKKGEPFQYVIGWLDFLACRVDLRFRPFIPRPETEYWVNEVLKTPPRGRPIKCLDLFAGSGCIGLALLKHLPQARVDFGENDLRALKQIQFNLKLNQLTKRGRVIKTDVFSNIEGPYDYIFANPPYVARRHCRQVQKNVLVYEPAAALLAGADGLKYIRRFLAGAPKFLRKGGRLFLEFNPAQKPALEKLLASEGYCFKFYRDQFGRWRYLAAGRL